MELPELFFAIFLSALFIIAFTSFGNQLALDNDTNISLLNDSAIRNVTTNLTFILNEGQNKSNDRTETFWSGIPVVGEVTVVLSTVVGVGKDLALGVLPRTFEAITTLVKSTGLVGNLVLTVFIGMFGSLIIFAAWRFFITGR